MNKILIEGKDLHCCEIFEKFDILYLFKCNDLIVKLMSIVNVW